MSAPNPKPDRYKRPELQSAYESGFRQEYDHDSFVLLDRFSWMLDEGSRAQRAERMAAALEGAADALRALAASRKADVPVLRALDEEGL